MFHPHILLALAGLHCHAVIAGPPVLPDPYQHAVPTTVKKPTCRFNGLVLPSKVAIFASGAYAGRLLDQQIDESGHWATRIDITVNHPETPVVLMLGAYEPTVWNISWAADTRIVAVFASGYHRQAIAGLDKSVPTLISTFDNAGQWGYFHVDADKTSWLNPLAQILFGQAVDRVYLAKNGAVNIGFPVQAKKAVTSSQTPPEFYFSKLRPLSGLAGVNEAVKNADIRRANQEDSDAWLVALNQNTVTTGVPPIDNADLSFVQAPRLFNAYVVLKPFAYPPGLYGANSATFFIPHGVPVPTGDKGHSTLYDFNTLSCRGPACIVLQE